MRPLRLCIKGLNSFSEEQCIDFERLTDHGFFGIFGPTGSGKSSILDGITLALYGEIPRGSDEYINKNMDAAHVVFDFQLTGAECRRYRVEREVRRNPKGGIRTAFARLMKLGEPHDEVLEEKVTAVKARCEEIIGLKAEDFARTVVLPQGKFSEFLKLQNGPRRQMLERIFNLEQYGEVLMDRVSHRLKLARDEQNRLAGSLMAYGDISSEGLSALRGASEAAEQGLVQAKGAEAQARLAFMAADEIRQLQEEWENTLAQISEAEARQEAMAAQGRALDDGERANAVKPLWDAWVSANQAHQGATVHLTFLKEQAGMTGTVQQAAQAEARSCTQLLETEMPRVSGQIAELEALLTALRQLQEQENDQGLRAEAVACLRKEVEALGALRKERELELSQARQRIAGIEAALDGLRYTESFRKQVSDGLLEQRELARVRAGLEQNGLQLQALKEAIAQIEAETTAATGVRDEILLKAKATEARQRQHMAAMIRQALQPGEPCPVCGSTEHPTPRQADGAAGTPDAEGPEALRMLWEQAAQEEKRLGELSGRLGAARSQHLTAEEDRASLQVLLEDGQKRLALIADQVGSEDIGSLAEKIGHADRETERLAEDLKQTRQALAVLEGEAAADQERLHSAEDRLGREEAALEALRQSSAERRKALEAQMTENGHPEDRLQAAKGRLAALREASLQAQSRLNDAEQADRTAREALAAGEKACQVSERHANESQERLQAAMNAAEFSDADAMQQSLRDPQELAVMKRELLAYQALVSRLEGARLQTEKKLQGRSVTEAVWAAAKEQRDMTAHTAAELEREAAALRTQLARMTADYETLQGLLKEKELADRLASRLEDLSRLFAGRRFVAYVASARLKHICGQASVQLLDITSGAYALEADAEGNFMVRDFRNGGALRETATLSGGETFMVSLALALALSAQIQLKGRAQLELFFLDEGFGTLDDETLDTVLGVLENMPHEKLSIGLISHVEAIRNRVPAKLTVTPARSGLGGSRVRFELS